MPPPARGGDIHIQVKGLNTFARECRAIGKQAQAKLRATNLKAAGLVVPEAVRRAPKGLHQGGGRVAPIGISIRAVAGQRYAAVRAGSKRTPHAAPEEFGGTLKRHASTSKTKVPARPYVFPAVDAMKQQVNDSYMDDFVDLLRQAFPF